MILLNFSHPLTPEHLQQVEALTGEPLERVLAANNVQFDPSLPFAPQVVALVDSLGLTAEEWQTLPILVNPPSYNFVAVTLLAELHGRMGYFPDHLRLRPVPDATVTRFEVAEILNLQAVRNAARRRRG